MRSIVYVAFSAILLSRAIAPALSAEPTAANAEPRKYIVEFRIVKSTEAGEQTLGRPKIGVVENRKASFSVLSDRPFVVAVSPTDSGAFEPVVETLSEGRKIDLACYSTGTSHVTLDVTIEETQIVDVGVKEIDDEISIQEPRVEITKVRRFVTGRLGETLVIPLDGKSSADSKKRAEVVVKN